MASAAKSIRVEKVGVSEIHVLGYTRPYTEQFLAAGLEWSPKLYWVFKGEVLPAVIQNIIIGQFALVPETPMTAILDEPAAEVGETTVVNFNDVMEYWDKNRQKWTDPKFVYIGRAAGGKRLPASRWGNQHVMQNQTQEERQRVIAAYREDLLKMDRATLLKGLRELKGKTLVCWCKKPDREVACHGDVLLEMIKNPPPLEVEAKPSPVVLSPLKDWERKVVETEAVAREALNNGDPDAIEKLAESVAAGNERAAIVERFHERMVEGEQPIDAAIGALDEAITKTYDGSLAVRDAFPTAVWISYSDGEKKVCLTVKNDALKIAELMGWQDGLEKSGDPAIQTFDVLWFSYADLDQVVSKLTQAGNEVVVSKRLAKVKDEFVVERHEKPVAVDSSKLTEINNTEHETSLVAEVGTMPDFVDEKPEINPTSAICAGCGKAAMYTVERNGKRYCEECLPMPGALPKQDSDWLKGETAEKPLDYDAFKHVKRQYPDDNDNQIVMLHIGGMWTTWDADAESLDVALTAGSMLLGIDPLKSIAGEDSKKRRMSVFTFERVDLLESVVCDAAGMTLVFMTKDGEIRVRAPQAPEPAPDTSQNENSSAALVDDALEQTSAVETLIRTFSTHTLVTYQGLRGYVVSSDQEFTYVKTPADLEPHMRRDEKWVTKHTRAVSPEQIIDTISEQKTVATMEKISAALRRPAPETEIPMTALYLSGRENVELLFNHYVAAIKLDDPAMTLSSAKALAAAVMLDQFSYEWAEVDIEGKYPAIYEAFKRAAKQETLMVMLLSISGAAQISDLRWDENLMARIVDVVAQTPF